MSRRSTYRYVMEKAKEIVKAVALSSSIDFYVVPHGAKNGSGDIFGMWDMIARDTFGGSYYFIQVTGKRGKSIKEHGLDRADNYIFSGYVIRYLLISYRKGRGGRYRFKVEEIERACGKLKFREIDILREVKGNERGREGDSKDAKDGGRRNNNRCNGSRECR